MSDYFKNKEYLDRLNVDYNLNGDEAKLHHCPICETANSFTKPYGIFSVNVSKGVYHCFHKKSCGETGTLYGLMLKLGIIDPLQGAVKKAYVIPKSKPALLSDTDKFYKWYEETRGIKKEILEKYSVGLHIQEDQKCMVYSYIEKDDNGTETVFNRKYKGITDKKVMWTEKGAKQGYYGLQHVDFSKDPNLYICEGEDDCHALVQYGIPNVVSVPFGAGNYNIEMDKVNSKAQCLLLFFDCDEAGQKGAYTFAKKAGLHKCHNILLPFKDARDCIMNKVEDHHIFKAMASAQQFKNEEIQKAGEHRDDVKDVLYGNGRLGIMTNEKAFNKVTKGIRMSEMSILTGHSGAGKTTFGYNLVSWMLDKDIPCLSMSFENRMSAIIIKMIAIRSQQVVREYDEEKNQVVVRMTEETIDSNIDAIDRLPLYFLNKDGSESGYYDMDKMESIIEYAVKYYNVQFFFIDHLHYFLKLSNSRNPTQLMDECLRRIKRWTEKHNIHIVLVVHPSKPSGGGKAGESKLSMYSGKGSASIVQESDNFWIVGRGEDAKDNPVSLFTEEKNREHGLGLCNSVQFDVLDNKSSFVRGEAIEKESF